ncbi:CHAP domain-containing protein [Acrocarpospora macrocephala]|nr:CHAP domain-containing protein [Acrocarpospora macrocephala]
MAKLIALLRQEIGYTERPNGHTKFGKWYNNVEQDADYSTQAWCDMFLSWGAHKLGYQEWFGQFAWTVGHARWFREQGAWGDKPVPGAVVFYDWDGSGSLDGIDHIGLVTGVDGKEITTIEGNVDGSRVREKSRDQSAVVGYGYPEKIKERLQPAQVKTDTEPEAVKPPDVISGDAPENASEDPAAKLATREGRPNSHDHRDQQNRQDHQGHQNHQDQQDQQGQADQQGQRNQQDRTAQGPAPKKHANKRTSEKPSAKTAHPKSQQNNEGIAGHLAAFPVSAVQHVPAGGIEALNAQALIAPLLLAVIALGYAKTRRTRVNAVAATEPPSWFDPAESTAELPRYPHHPTPPQPQYRGKRRKPETSDIYRSGALPDALKAAWAEHSDEPARGRHRKSGDPG